MKGIKIMKKLIKDNLKFLVFLAIFGLVGGYFTALYTVQILTQEMLDEVVAQVGSIDVLIVITTLQSLSYALILGIIGKILAKKIGVWRNVTFNKKGNIELILVTLVGGAAFILLDVLIFGNFSEVIKDSYAIKPTLEYIIASVTYGAVIEEIMLRLFFMSLIAFIIQKIAKKEEMNDRILMIANVIAALLFAAAHLPATIMSISPITPMIIFRCFLLNGGFGLMFGRLYRKYGIHYAMIAHGGVHIVSKLIWILFI
jgi:hypothetical protein